MYQIFCIHYFVEGQLGSFQLLAIINKAAMNIVEHVFLLPVGTSSGYMPTRGLLDLPIVLCPIFWGTAGLISRVFVQACNPTSKLSPHLCQHLLSPEFLILAILTGVRWISGLFWFEFLWWLRIMNTFFRFFSTLQNSSAENSLFSSEPHFLMGLFNFLESTFLSSLYIHWILVCYLI